MISSSKRPAKTESLAMPRASPPAESVPMALLNPFTNVAPTRKKKELHIIRPEISEREIKQATDVDRTVIILNPLTRTDLKLLQTTISGADLLRKEQTFRFNRATTTNPEANLIDSNLELFQESQFQYLCYTQRRRRQLESPTQRTC